MKIELKINGKAIELSEETKEQIKKACGQVKVRPNEGDKYWVLDSGGDIFKEEYMRIFGYDEGVWNSGNGFFTKEEAEKELSKRQAIQRVKDYIKENGMYYEPDWSDDDIQKWSFRYDYDNEKVVEEYQYQCKYYSPIGYLKSREDAEKVLKDCVEDLLLIFK